MCAIEFIRKGIVFGMFALVILASACKSDQQLEEDIYRKIAWDHLSPQ